jgi:hypothetical protein
LPTEILNAYVAFLKFKEVYNMSDEKDFVNGLTYAQLMERAKSVEDGNVISFTAEEWEEYKAMRNV